MARFVVPVVVLVALVGGYVVGQQPDSFVEPKAPLPRRCVGIATSVLRQNPTITRIYRAFEDGTIESFDDGNPQAKWATVDK